ncbi:putative membrane protein [Hoeflea phototrophica DFL-43]|jgi:uncharacterized membrane protein|uniref:Putative membrane protein n=1 Tax=Hoeflea phototrophica (strain DSM 17068 / NCIMB 14078 / DFL-43) TaxID=411684 RepID=A9DCS3_HOEPD|nr:DUF599 family protein [Hoeflea phototrophica]EDQ32195.1 putative membrane protein [Hoeflea phototrophica DFL-43]
MSDFDYIAIAWFALGWVGFAALTDGRIPIRRISLTRAMNENRRLWMRTAARRDLRMIDTAILAGLQNGTAFFASTTILAIGGCFALLGSTEQVLDVAGDLPIPLVADRVAFEAKVFGLIGIFAYAFFKFGWSYRLFNYSSILFGAIPMKGDVAGNMAELDASADRAAEINILAGRHFNAGLRAIFMSIGYLGWFAGPYVLIGSTTLVVLVLLRRQFLSNARSAILKDTSTK